VPDEHALDRKSLELSHERIELVAVGRARRGSYLQAALGAEKELGDDECPQRLDEERDLPLVHAAWNEDANPDRRLVELGEIAETGPRCR
jgi:hypothetical protein